MAVIDDLKDFKVSRLREGQLGALDVIFERILASEPYTSIVLPTRYGKSDVIRLAAFQLKKYRQISTSFILNPNSFLRTQIIDRETVDEMKKDYCINKRTKMYSPAYPSVQAMGKEDEDIVSLTIQWITQPLNTNNMQKKVDHIIHKHKVRPVFFIDECHTGSENNTWGEFPRKMVDAGALCVLLTATARRSDNERITGFKYETISENDKIRRAINTKISERLALVDYYASQDIKLRLVPDFERTFEEAWNEDDSPLCKLDRKTFDIDLEKFISGFSVGDKASLYDLSSLTLIKKALKNAIRDKITIRDGCERFVDQLLFTRETTPDATGIIFCANDIEGRPNSHPQAIKKALSKINKNLSATILTSTSDDDVSEDAVKELKLFAKGQNGDIIIVKQMAGLGLNAPMLKVGLDLSPTRTWVSYVQRLMRVATPYNGRKTAVWISPNDKISDALWIDCVENHGGEVVERSEELIRTTIEEIKPSPVKEEYEWLVMGSCHGPMSNQKGEQVGPEGWDYGRIILGKFKELAPSYTETEVVLAFQSIGGSFVNPKTVDVEEEKQTRIGQIQEAMATITGHRLRQLNLDYGKHYRSIIKTVYAEVCRRSGITTKPDPDSKRTMDGHSIKELEILRETAERMRHEEEFKAQGTKLYACAY